MITVTLPRPVRRILGGTPEERRLHLVALEMFCAKDVVFVDPDPGAQYHVTFNEAMRELNDEINRITATMYVGADSMWSSI